MSERRHHIVATLIPAAGVVLASAAYALACPPRGWAELAWIVPGALLVPLARVAPHRALLWGGLFGLLMGAGVTGWAIPAARTYFDNGPLLPTLLVVGVWLLNGSLPYGLLAAAYAWVAPRVPAAARGPVGAWLWIGAELLRAHLFTGLPWELLGHTQYDRLLLIQVADLGGVYGVSFVIALVSVTAGELLAAPRAAWRAPWKAAGRLALPALALLAVLGYGASSRERYLVSPPPDAPRVAVVQGDLPNALRWQRGFVERAVLAYAALTPRFDSTAADLIVWPENAVGGYLDRDAMLRSGLATVARRVSGGLLVGAPRLDRAQRAFNSAFLIGASGQVLATYDKRRLLPFAEYNPLATAAVAAPMTAEPAAFTAGGLAAPIPTGTFNLGTVICYEVVFPQLVRDLVLGGADLLVNLSNDAWMNGGTGAAAQQHLSIAVFRAVETRRYLVRAAAGGVSGFVTPYGLRYGLLPAGVARASVAPVLARSEITPYVRWGDWWVVAGLLAIAAQLSFGRHGTA